MTPERKQILLRAPAGILNAEIYGLDARNPEEFNECILRTALQCDVLVGAGGDGTLATIVNVIDRSITPVGFLPLGTGNALRHALQLRGSLADIALQIRNAPVRQLDLIDCSGRVAFSASVGIEAAVLRVRMKYPRLRRSGFCAYLFAALIAYFRTYNRVSGLLEVDGLESRLNRLLTLLVVKHPYHGFRMRVVPEAKLDDGKLHILAVTSGFWRSIFWGVAAFFTSNRTGQYHTGKSVMAVFDQPLSMQADGEEWWQARAFRFEVLHKAIMVKA
jgi:diacylglycerol kinase family enzyme